VLQLTAYYPRRSQKSMGATGNQIYYFFLTKYTDSSFDIYQNNIIKMWEQFRILEFPLIILFILIGGIFLMFGINPFVRILGLWMDFDQPATAN